MGAIWLHNLPEVLAGLPNLSFYQGWESRSRASGGYDKLLGIFVHHTASQHLDGQRLPLPVGERKGAPDRRHLPGSCR